MTSAGLAQPSCLLLRLITHEVTELNSHSDQDRGDPSSLICVNGETLFFWTARDPLTAALFHYLNCLSEIILVLDQ